MHCSQKPHLALLVLLYLLNGAFIRCEILLLISCPAHHNCLAVREHIHLQQYQLQLDQTIPQDYVIKVHIIHELFNYWTLLDALPYLQSQTRLLNAHTEWIIWCQPNTYVSSLRALLEQLQRQDATEMAYYGHALFDVEATIIHHFANYKNPTWFPYPMLSAGIVFTGRLLRSLVELVDVNASTPARHSEFAIDAAHELARFIFDNVTPDCNSTCEQHKTEYNVVDKVADDNILHRKIILKSVAYICPSGEMSPSFSLEKTSKRAADTPMPCIMYAKPEAAVPALPSALANEVNCLQTTSANIYFAIKTCAKFHKERIPIIERTWAPDAMHRKYYSDVADAGIPTINTGIPNVETGHCSKTLAILQLSLKDIDAQMKWAYDNQRPTIRWLMLVDDDTLLSVPRLNALLSCYNHTAYIYLGQRYGYRLYASDGFNYLTGGAGILLSLPLARLIVQHCSCPTPAAPDDMILGYCLQALGVSALHSPAFHQARPQDYASALLQLTLPISFHKYDITAPPEQTYTKWLGGSCGNLSLGSLVPAEKREYNLSELWHVGLGPGFDTASKHMDL